MRVTHGFLSVLLAVGLAGIAGATVVDLMTLNSSGTLNGGIFVQGGIQPAGTGVFGTFLKYQPGGKQADVQGYNTDGRALQYDEQSSATHTHSLELGDVPLYNCDASFMPGCVAGEQYRAFKLDINAKASDPLVSLDRVVIYDRVAGNLLGGRATEGTPLGGTNLFTGASDTLVYDSGASNRVDLNYLLESSGSGDGTRHAGSSRSRIRGRSRLLPPSRGPHKSASRLLSAAAHRGTAEVSAQELS